MRARTSFLPGSIPFVAAFFSAIAGAAEPLDQWYLRTTNSTLRSMVAADGKVVAVGDKGAYVVSAEGTNWMRGASLTDYLLLDVGFGAGTFVAVGEKGLVFSSTTGSNWVARASGTTQALNAVVYDGNRFLAAGGVVTVSTNGIDWSPPLLEGISFVDVCFANDRFVAVGWGVTAVSPDGTNWSLGPGPNFLSGVTYGNGRYVAVGSGVAGTSLDGTNWSFNPVPFPFTGNRVQFGGGVFVTADPQGRIWSSTDGVTWQARFSGGNFLLGGLFNNDSHWIVGKGIWQSELLSRTNTPPNIFTEPQDVAAYEFNSFVVSVSCYSPGPTTYQWFQDGNPMPGETASTLVFNNAQVSQSGLYHVVITNSFGAATSRWANVSIQAIPTGPLDIWHWRVPAASGNSVTAITGTNGVAVALTDFGEILTSVDRTNWVRRDSKTRNFLYGVAAGGGSFVAVGARGTLVTSSNGFDWESVASHTTNTLFAVTYGGGKFVAVGTDTLYGQRGCVLTSTNGRHWQESSSGTNAPLRTVAFNGEKYVALGSDTYVATSPDGIAWSWTALHFSLYGFVAMAGGPGRFVAANGNIYTSVDGTSWNAVGSPPGVGFDSLAYQEGVFVAGGGSGLARSTNGMSWTLVPGQVGTVGIVDGVFGLMNRGPTLATSMDGQTWNPPLASSSLFAFHAIAEHNGVLVTLGDWGSNMISADGLRWAPGYLGASNAFSDAISAGGLLVAAGGRVIATSLDATNWTTHSLGTNDVIRFLAHGNGTFVGVGSSLFTSPDASTWTRRNISASPFQNIAFGNGFFIASGYYNLYISTDGVNWTVRPPIVVGSSARVWFGNGRFVSTTLAGIYVSTDGTNWVRATTPPGYNPPLTAAAAGPTGFIAVGIQGTVMTSPDGMAWTWQDTRFFNTFSRALYAKNSFTIVGAPFVIRQSEPLVATAPILFGIREHVSVYEGAAISLEAPAFGSAPVEYQWFKNGNLIAGVTKPVFDVLNAQLSDSGLYHVSVSNSIGTMTRPIQVSVVPASLRIADVQNGVAHLQMDGALGRHYLLETRATLDQGDQWNAATPFWARMQPASLAHTNDNSGHTHFYKVRLTP
jgi:hypothetical protein